MTSILTPVIDSDAIDLGRLWRKQVLKFGQIRTNDGRMLDINADLANEAVRAYTEGAFDQTPFQLCDGNNAHNSDPERFRGEVKGFEVTGDGLDMLMEPSAKGAELLKENPRLGVSARIVPDYTRSDGKKFAAAIEHVAGTLNPVVTGMRPWQAVSLSSTDTGQVIDLTREEYVMADPTTEQTQQAPAVQDAAAGTQTTAAAAPAETTAPVVDEQAATAIADKLSEEDIAAIAALLQEDDTEESETEEEPAMATANLSAQAQAAIDLANTTAQAAQDRTAALEVQLANERADREAANYLTAGVPPAMVNLARPALSMQGQAIDLSNGSKTDSGAIIRGLLDAAKGTIDLSGEKGHGDMSADDKQKHESLMAQWAKDSWPELADNSK